MRFASRTLWVLFGLLIFLPGSRGIAAPELQIVVGSAPGGGDDIAARLAARHLGNFLPEKPNPIVVNMVGASGVKAANYLYAVAPQDGSVIAIFNGAMPYYQAVGLLGTRFKSEELSWIGSMNQGVSVVVVWHATGLKTLEDTKRTEVIMGAMTGGGTMGSYPKLLNAELGTKFKVVSGYKNGAQVNLAMERGEIQGRGSTPWWPMKSSHPNWIRDGKIVPLVQIGTKKSSDLSNVPLLTDLAQTPEQSRVFDFMASTMALEQPFVAPPNVTSQRLKELRDAFDRMMKDPGFLNDAQTQGMQLDPLSGDEVTKIVKRLINTSPDVIDKVRKATDEK